MIILCYNSKIVFLFKSKTSLRSYISKTEYPSFTIAQKPFKRSASQLLKGDISDSVAISTACLQLDTK